MEGGGNKKAWKSHFGLKKSAGIAFFPRPPPFFSAFFVFLLSAVFPFLSERRPAARRPARPRA
jgi:drug/metabolite transporter (DMT)-like permease